MAAPRKGTMTKEAPKKIEEVEEAPEVTEPADDQEDVTEGGPEQDPEVVEEEEWDSRKQDPEEELWEDGPNFAQINAWKDQYGDVYVTSLTPETHVVWRTLTRFEYRRLIKNLEQAISTGAVSQGEANLNNEEQIAELCILFPEYSRQNNVGVMAGVASTIAQQVMEASAFVSMEVRQL